MSIFLLAAALSVPFAAPKPDRIFACSFGAKQLEIIGNGDRLIYRFGQPGRPELVLNGSPAGGVFYYRTTYVRGADTTLRFARGRYQYVVFNRWTVPYELSTGERPPAANNSGVLIYRDGTQVERLDCRTGGELREWPIFKRLKQDEGQLLPSDIG